ncbi:DUF2786 domain-containing protein [Kushneria indalinina]|uniref:Uncharacterized protein DUF2786 n=1 Tax=Kushneria indalinina DSM 14324 TaxID=1122140 RepID=A0A3D9DRV5_9GAMM|nr:DUF2786 domain-containing protein [Kushneria indalinina]REC93401.1 uncharacterized protein DUF2786 [Kushneria indalinina DSM 14324]
MIPDRILRKIERCLALSQSANKHEAGTALRHAQRMMDEYGVKEVDIAASAIDRIAVKSSSGLNPPAWLDRLASLINAAFGTATVYEPSPTLNGWQGRFAFLGESSQATIAAYAFEVLQRQLVNDRKSFMAGMNQRAKRVTKIRRADAYAMAWVSGAYEHILPVKKTDEAVAAIERFQARFYNKMESMNAINRGQKRDDHKAMARGYEAGRQAQLHHGVDKERRQELPHG